MSPRPLPFRLLALSTFAAFAVVPACSSTPDTVAPPDNRPPRICKVPADAPQPWFHEVTDEVGLGKTGTLEPIAVGVIAADLDGDGFPDLVTYAGNSARGTVTDTKSVLYGKRLRFLFMNRPDPQDPTKRVFVDTMADSGLLTTRDGKGDRGYGLVNAGDLDDDGDVDLLLCPSDVISSTYSPEDPCDAFLNDGKGHFTLAPASDLDKKVTWVGSGALFDYDRDGVLDFWPATVAHWPYDPNGPNDEPPTLYRGNGDGTFTNVSAQVGLPTKDGTLIQGTQWRHVFGVTACDIDGDGDDDMIFASYGREENQVWRNDGGTFVNVAHDLGVDHDDREDYSDDQSYRCYCAATPGACPASVPAPSPASFCNAFGNGMGRGWMPNISDKSFSLGGNNFTVACGDIDDDGDMDLMSATIVHGDVGSSEDPSELILNPGDGSKFTRPGNQANGIDRPETGIYWNHGDDMAVFADLDLDGRKDIFMTTTGAYGAVDRAHLWHQKADGTFEEIGMQSGVVGKSFLPNHQGPVFVDIDGDGDLDLIDGQTDGTQTMHAYRNDVGQSSNWLKVRLVGKGKGGANVSAVGAVVRVTAGGRTQTLEVQGGYGHGNQESGLVQTFGLGAACDVDKVEVRWPSGDSTVSTFTDVRANYAIELHEGDANVHYPGG